VKQLDQSLFDMALEVLNQQGGSVTSDQLPVLQHVARDEAIVLESVALRETRSQSVLSVAQTVDGSHVELQEKIGQSEHSQDVGLRRTPNSFEKAVTDENSAFRTGMVANSRNGGRKPYPGLQEALWTRPNDRNEHWARC
jgi:hypothetical protein